MDFVHRYLVGFVYRRSIPILIVALALSAVAGHQASKLRLETDFIHLLSQNDASVRELNRIKERVGGIGPLSIIIAADDLSKAAEFMLVLADSLDNDPNIGAVIRGKDAGFFSKNRLLYMDREDLETIHVRLDDYVEEEKYRQSPLYVAFDDEEENELDFSDIEEKYRRHKSDGLERDYYITDGGEGVVLRIYPTGVITDVEFYQALIQDIERDIESIGPDRFDPSIEFTYKGSFKNTLYQYGVIVSDLQATVLYSVVGVFFLVTLYFRHPLIAFLIALSLAMSLTWTFGVTQLVIGNLNQITIGLFAILFGLGIDFGIHIFARYREARRRGNDTVASLDESINSTGRALTTTAVTTALAFYSLMLTDFRGFSEFGFIVGTGILFALAAMLVVGPALIVVAERLNLMRLGGKEVPPHLLRRGPFPFPRATLLLGLFVVAVSIYKFSDVEFEYDFGELRPKMPTQNEPEVPKSFRDAESPAIVLTETREEALQVVSTVEGLKAEHGDSSTVRAVKSVYSLLPADQDEKLETIASIRDLVDDSSDLIDDADRARVDSLRDFLDVRKLELEDLPPNVTKSFSGKSGELLNFVTIFASVPLRDGRNAMKFSDEIGRIEPPSGDVFFASSAHIIFARMLRLMLHDGAIAIGLTLLTVFIVLAIDLRNPGHALVVLLPLLVALSWVVGSMAVFGIKLNLYNIVTFPTIIGMGIDNGVHIFHRYREAGRDSLRLVLRTTGVALTATSLTTMVGFAGLVPAQHPALHSIGILSLIGLFCSYVTAVIVLPAALQLFENKQAGSDRRS